MTRSKLPWLTPKELVAVIVIGVLTSLVDHQVEQLLLPYFAALQVQIHVFDYTSGPVICDLLLVWLQYGGVLAAYLFRKPGSGTIAMTINGFVQVYVNGIHAPHLLYGVSGLGADLVFDAFRYKRYDLRIAALAGTASEVFWYPIVYFTHGVYLYPTTFILTDLVVRILASRRQRSVRCRDRFRHRAHRSSGQSQVVCYSRHWARRMIIGITGYGTGCGGIVDDESSDQEDT